MIFTVATTVMFFQAKYNNKMLFLQEMIDKSLFIRESPSITPSPPHGTTPNVYLGNNSLPKTIPERRNQANLGYFNPHLDRAHRESEILLVEKDVYYRNVVLFVQCFQNLVTFQHAAFIKVNITLSLWGFALKWYISKLSNFDCNMLNNNLGVKSWINNLFHYFKLPMSIAFSLLINETYTLDNAQTQRLFA